MSHMNKVTLIGSVAEVPDIERPAPDQVRCRFEVTTRRSYRDACGARQEQSDRHPVLISGRTAETWARQLVKGRHVFIQGRLETHPWQDAQGHHHISASVLAARVVFLGPASGGGGRGRGAATSR